MPERDTSPPYVEQVVRAQAGELAAFGELVGSFQDLVVGSAFGWLRDIELARDVAQEAFANAHASLGQLTDPAAFPGWLRRIVRKHCDRVTRRGRLEVVPREPDESPGHAPAADQALADRRESERLRRAVEALPEPERLPLVLHYFAGEPQPGLAEFLEIPLPTLKKRLRQARARLRESGLLSEGRPEPSRARKHPPSQEDEPMTESTALRPSRDPRFSATVQFYLALRAGDTSQVASMLAQAPELAEAEQRWDAGLVYDGVLPFASSATPLVTAVERADLAMVELLLAKGASPDGPCGCATGEAPLWAAVLLQQPAIARRLLEAGADPNRRAATGNAPIHLAAMREAADLVALLLRHGADPELRDRAGRTARDWASAKGHDAIAALLPGASDEPSVAQASPCSAPRLHETGIRAVDLFAPLSPGALVRVPFRAGVGMLVLLNELSQRWTTKPSGAVLWTGFAQGPFDPEDLRGELREAGIGGVVAVHVAPREEAPETRRKEFAEGIERALALRDAGGDVLLVVLSATGFEIDTEASLARLCEPGAGGTITTLVVSPFENRQEDGRTPLRAPWDARITLDRRRAQRGLFPALDPVGSGCRGDLESLTGERHARVSAEARELLAGYERLDPSFDLPEPDSLDDAEREGARRAQRLLRYLTQPFVTTEPFTGQPGRPIRVPELLDRVETILAGKDVPADVELTPGG